MAKVFPYNSTSLRVVLVDGGTLSYRENTGETTSNRPAFDLFADDFAVGDYIVFGSYEGGNGSINPSGGFAWNKLTINIETAIAATSFDGVWEYYGYATDGTGSATWRTLTCVDNTNKFQNTGERTVEFTIPPYHSGAQTIGSSSYRVGFPIRFRITAVDTPTEGGRIASSITTRQIYGIKVTDETVTPESLYTWQLGAGYGIMTEDNIATMRQYQLNCSLLIGIGGKLQCLNQMLTIGSKEYQQYALGTEEASTVTTESDVGIIQLGEPYSTGLPTGIGNSKNGGTLVLRQRGLNIGGGNSLSIVRMYGSTMVKQEAYGGGEWGFHEITCVDSMLLNTGGYHTFNASASTFKNNSLYNFTYSTNGLWYLYCDIHNGDDIKMSNSCLGLLCGATAKLRGLVMRSDQQIERYYSANVTFIDCVLCNTSLITSQEIGSTGTKKWFKHYFSVNMKVVEQDGTAIENATINIYDKDGTLTATGTSDSSGVISELLVLQYHKEWEKKGTTGEHGGGTVIIDIDYNPFTTTITKTGYETYYQKQNITSKINQTITLKKAVPNLIDDSGRIFRKINSVNQGNNRHFIIKL